MRKLLVFLILPLLVSCFLLVGLHTASATTLFSSGFETNDFSEWDEVTETPLVSDDVAHSGTYSCLIEAAQVHDYVYNNPIDYGREFYFSSWIYFDSSFGSGLVSYIMLRNFTASVVVSELLLFPGSVRVDYAGSQVATNDTYSIPSGQWVHILYGVKLDSTGFLKLWFDDDLVINYETDLSASVGIGAILIGDMAGFSTHPDYFFDDVAITDTNPMTPTPTPTPTPTASPSPSPSPSPTPVLEGDLSDTQWFAGALIFILVIFNIVLFMLPFALMRFVFAIVSLALCALAFAYAVPFSPYLQLLGCLVSVLSMYFASRARE